MSSWGRIHRSLRDLMPQTSIDLGCRSSVSSGCGGMTAIFANGIRERGDILIGPTVAAPPCARSFCPI